MALTGFSTGGGASRTPIVDQKVTVGSNASVEVDLGITSFDLGGDTLSTHLAGNESDSGDDLGFDESSSQRAGTDQIIHSIVWDAANDKYIAYLESERGESTDVRLKVYRE